MPDVIANTRGYLNSARIVCFATCIDNKPSAELWIY